MMRQAASELLVVKCWNLRRHWHLASMRPCLVLLGRCAMKSLRWPHIIAVRPQRKARYDLRVEISQPRGH
eukprot:2589448-Rhodomonas_salina.2